MNYRKYGLHHGSCVRHDPDKPDRDAFLAYMEARLPENGADDYMDGFYDAMLGNVHGYRYARRGE